MTRIACGGLDCQMRKFVFFFCASTVWPTLTVRAQWLEDTYDDSLFIVSLSNEANSIVEIDMLSAGGLDTLSCQQYVISGDEIVEYDTCSSDSLVYYRKRTNGHLDSLVTASETGKVCQRLYFGNAKGRNDISPLLRQVMPSEGVDVPLISEWKVYDKYAPANFRLFRYSGEHMIDSMRVHHVNDSVFVEYAYIHENLGDTVTYRLSHGKLFESSGTSGYRSKYEYDEHGGLVRKSLWGARGSLRIIEFYYNEARNIVRIDETERWDDENPETRTFIFRHYIP